jgi:mono/diheme cytochrome c family protein
MKNRLIVLLPAIALSIILTAFITENKPSPRSYFQEDGFTIPEDVNAIFDKSCFGCHNSESDSDKAKDKLTIDKLGELSKAKLVGKLGEIGEVVGKNEMPPEKFLAKYPDKALTGEEAKRLSEWTETAAEELLK